jgi:hypothetical protein
VIYPNKEQALDRQCPHIIMKAGEAGKGKGKAEVRSQNSKAGIKGRGPSFA